MLKRLTNSFKFNTRELCFILTGGLGFFFGFPNSLIQISPLVLVFPFAASCLVLEAQSCGKAVAATFCTFILGGFLASYWLVYPMINYGSVPLPLAVIFVFLLGFFVVLYYIAYAILLRFYYARLPLPLTLLAGAFTWGALEYARGWLFTGVTWFSLGSAMPGMPVLAQGASLAGMYGLSVWLVLIALCLVPLAGRISTGSRLLSRGIPVAGGILAALLIIYGLERTGQDFKNGGHVLIAQAQGNIDQAQKWNPAKQQATVKHYIDLTREAIAKSVEQYGKKPDLLVWPETAMPFYFQHAYAMGRPVRDMVTEEATPLLFGVPGRGARLSDPESYNRVWLLDAEGKDAGYYDKEHLLPFGEYIPKGLYVPFASEFLQGYGFTPGTFEKPLQHKNFLFGILICYEAIFPELAQTRVSAGANILVNVSNDAWFADSPAPWQHLQLSSMRAIEQGRYMIRSTNTGASAMIDPAGRAHGIGPLFENYASAHEAWLLTEKTFFNQNYDWINKTIAYSPFAFILLSLVIPRRKNARL